MSRDFASVASALPRPKTSRNSSSAASIGRAGLGGAVEHRRREQLLVLRAIRALDVAGEERLARRRRRPRGRELVEVRLHVFHRARADDPIGLLLHELRRRHLLRHRAHEALERRQVIGREDLELLPQDLDALLVTHRGRGLRADLLGLHPLAVLRLHARVRELLDRAIARREIRQRLDEGAAVREAEHLRGDVRVHDVRVLMVRRHALRQRRVELLAVARDDVLAIQLDRKRARLERRAVRLRAARSSSSAW
jgi:hypothetical protein